MRQRCDSDKRRGSPPSGERGKRRCHGRRSRTLPSRPSLRLRTSRHKGGHGAARDEPGDAVPPLTISPGGDARPPVMRAPRRSRALIAAGRSPLIQTTERPPFFHPASIDPIVSMTQPLRAPTVTCGHVGLRLLRVLLPKTRAGLGRLPRERRPRDRRAGCPGLLPVVRRSRVQPPIRGRRRARLHLETTGERHARADGRSHLGRRSPFAAKRSCRTNPGIPATSRAAAQA